jgi:hypothetical protein
VAQTHSHVWTEFLSSEQTQTAMLPQGNVRFWQEVLTPGGTSGGVGGLLFFFFLASASIAPRPSVASAPALIALKLRRDLGAVLVTVGEEIDCVAVEDCGFPFSPS